MLNALQTDQLPNSLVTSITASLLVSLCFVVPGIIPLQLAFMKRTTHPASDRAVTQRGRYSLIFLALVCDIPTVWEFIHYGPHNVFEVLHELQSDAVFAFVLLTGTWIGILMPIFAALTALRVYFRPSRFAYRVRLREYPAGKFYVLTEDRRKKVKDPTLVKRR